MGTTQMRVTVVGAGAIGGACAGMIQRAGYPVQLVARRDEQAVAVNENQVEILGIRGNWKIPVPAVAGVEKMDRETDIVLLASKATDMLEIAEQLKSLPAHVPVVSLQNGFCEDALAEVLGRDRVIGCVTGWGATMISDHQFEITSDGEFVIGNIDAKDDPRLADIQTLLSQVCTTRISPDITAELYSKLIINACITSVGALCGLYLGEMLAQKNIRNLFCAVMSEAMAVSRAMDLTVPPYGGKLDYYGFDQANGFLGRIKRHLILWIVGRKYKDLKSSSLQSLHRGRKTEIDYLTGYITSHGKRLGVPTPVNDQILEMVHAIEAGTRKISVENLAQIQMA